MRRGAPWVTLLLLLSVGAALLVASLSADPVPRAPEVEVPASTEELTSVVCDRVFGDLARQVAADAPAAAVVSDLEATVSIARAGADRDPSLEPLAAGAGALLESILTDDPGAATIALRVLRSACGRPA